MICINSQQNLESQNSTLKSNWILDFGGKTNEKVYAYTTSTLDAELTSERKTYTYGNSNWSDLLTAYNGTPITYDQIGNPTNYLGWNMTWQAGRQLASASKSGMSLSYKYDDDGIWQSKTVNDVTTSYTTIDGRITSQKTGNNLMYFYYDQDDRLIGFDYNSTKYVYVRNLQNDIIGIVDTAGTLVVEYAYDAWGNQVSCTGDLASTLGVDNPFRYRGYYFDTETGLYYLQSRYYDAQVGRFISADAADVLELSDFMLGSNLFAYCDNNPLMKSDPNGYGWFTNLKSWFKNAEISVSTWLLSMVIDATIAVLTSGTSLSFSVLGAAMKKTAKKELAESGKKAGSFIAKLLFEKVPKFMAGGIATKMFTAIRTAVWRLTGLTLYWLKQEWLTSALGFVGKYLRSANTLSQIIDVVTMFTSVGAFMAGLLDIFDGKFDGKVVFKQAGY